MADLLRVLLATDSTDPSGVGQHMLTLGKTLARSHEVVLGFPAEAAAFAEAARSAGLDART
jgi:hypothetical protein